jgi:hypothetical protein
MGATTGVGCPGAFQRLFTAGARFILVIPPSYQKRAETIAQADAQLGVNVLVPVGGNEFDATYYNIDGFHLNETGARIFTTRLAANLPVELRRP